jgi:hypothetical protein
MAKRILIETFAVIVLAIGIVLVAIVAALGLMLLIAHFTNRPPTEARIIANFESHRATYERLRDMLTADDKLLRVADWGIETDSGFVKPPEGPFPAARYNEYLALLKQVDAKWASRHRGNPAEPCVLVWASGFAGDTRHRSICWLTVEPENQVATLAAFERSPRPRKPAFKRIDGDWYIWADW